MIILIKYNVSSLIWMKDFQRNICNLDEQIFHGNNIYYETPVSDSACMAFNAQMKMNEDPQRKMVGLS